MNEKFTKGPWVARHTGLIIGAVGSLEEESVAKIKPLCYMPPQDAVETEKANAHLIAAAPLMFEELEYILRANEAYNGGFLTPREVSKIKTALQNARGEL